MPVPYILLMLYTCFAFFKVAAQEAKDDSLFVKSSVAYAKAMHRTTLAENLELYNGTVYDVTYIGAKGHPYFLIDTLSEGSLLYNGFLYEHVPVLYNVVTDEVLIESYDRLHNLQLVKNKLSRFTISGHSFIQLQNDSFETAMPAGFYEVLHHNKLLVLAKRLKVFQQDAKGQVLDSRFTSYDQYFIAMDGNYYPVTSLPGLLAAFGKQKGEVRSYLHKHKLNFKKDPESTIVNASIYYEQLSN